MPEIDFKIKTWVHPHTKRVSNNFETRDVTVKGHFRFRCQLTKVKCLGVNIECKNCRIPTDATKDRTLKRIIKRKGYKTQSARFFAIRQASKK